MQMDQHPGQARNSCLVQREDTEKIVLSAEDLCGYMQVSSAIISS